MRIIITRANYRQTANKTDKLQTNHCFCNINIIKYYNMKTLTQHIKESLKNKSTKKVEDKSVEEDLSDIMRTNPATNSSVMRGTLRDDENEK